jgi:hypothetical protein
MSLTSDKPEVDKRKENVFLVKEDNIIVSATEFVERWAYQSPTPSRNSVKL